MAQCHVTELLLVFFAGYQAKCLESHLSRFLVPAAPTSNATPTVGFRSSLTAFFLTDTNSGRIPALRDYIEASRIPESVAFDYWFVNWTAENDTQKRALYPPDEYRSLQNGDPGKRWSFTCPNLMSCDLIAKMFFSLRFFLENSSSLWFYRGTDDVAFNFPLLEFFLRDLHSKYVPERDFAFIANCIHSNTGTFPQGGSGFVLSRAAVRRIEPLARDFMRQLHSRPEDLAFGDFLASIGGSMAAMTSPFMMGHFAGSYLEQAIAENFTKIEECPAAVEDVSDGCRRFLAPVRDVVIFHANLGLQLDRNKKDVAHVFGADPALYWWMSGPQVMACRTERAGSWFGLEIAVMRRGRQKHGSLHVAY
jgi:hypothetical protein